MRIVGGIWRGRAIEAPEGRGTRPTVDRVRESMASMVLSAFDLDLYGVRVLDAFAGSGAIGLELLSRGAQSCTFVERDRKAAGVVRANIKALGASAAQVRVQIGDASVLAERGALEGGPFELVVLDPPYAMEVQVVAQLLVHLRANGQLAQQAVILYEHATGTDEPVLEGAQVIKKKARGTTTVTLLRW